MADFSLKAVFGMDATGVRTELKELRRDFGDFVQEYAKWGAALAVGAFIALGKGAAAMASELKKTSLELGINVEKLQVLDSLALRNNESQETLRKALERTRISVQEAAEGNQKMASALQKLGINAAEIIRLPLEQQMTKIAQGMKNAANQSEAFNAVVDLFGAKVAPQLMNSLNELGGDNGFAKAAKAAKEAGHIMSAETIVALERAQSAIEEFKRKATVAVGNILVDFRSEEGIKLLGLQLMKAAAGFGGRILDALAEANAIIGAVLGGAFAGLVNRFRDGMISAMEVLAAVFNKTIPKSFAIDVSGLEKLRSDGKYVADSITEAIAKTAPSTFRKDFTDFWQNAIDQQQKLVDNVNHIDLGPEAQKLKDAGKSIQNSITTATNVIPTVVTPIITAAEKMATALIELQRTKGVTYGGGDPTSLTDTQLKSLASKTINDLTTQKIIDRDQGGVGTTVGSFKSIEQLVLQQQLDKLQSEIGARANFRNVVSQRGMSGAEATLPADQFNRFSALYGDSVLKQNELLTSIDFGVKQLTSL